MINTTSSALRADYASFLPQPETRATSSTVVPEPVKISAITLRKALTVTSGAYPTPVMFSGARPIGYFADIRVKSSDAAKIYATVQEQLALSAKTTIDLRDDKHAGIQLPVQNAPAPAPIPVPVPVPAPILLPTNPPAPTPGPLPAPAPAPGNSGQAPGHTEKSKEKPANKNAPSLPPSSSSTVPEGTGKAGKTAVSDGVISRKAKDGVVPVSTRDASLGEIRFHAKKLILAIEATFKHSEKVRK
jgi:hypothetical protein